MPDVEMTAGLASGWNTWNTRSVLSHVLLPHGLALNLGVKEYTGGDFLREALVGRKGPCDERIVPGPHAYDGSYTELQLVWKQVRITVQSAHAPGGLVVRVTADPSPHRTPLLVASIGLLWNRPGSVAREGDELAARLPDREWRVHVTTACVEEPQVDLLTPYLAVPLAGTVSVAVGCRVTPAEADALIEAAAIRHRDRPRPAGSLSEVYDAMQICLAWDTIYDPTHSRVVSPVSRIWSCNSGGYVLFCWDTYFAAAMAALESPALAAANAIAITDEMTEAGFVPNFAHPSGFKSRDRSQPPVGSLMLMLIHGRHDARPLMARLFDPLLRWNRWWPEHRDTDGYLCWGSDPYTPVYGNTWESNGVHARFGAALESGLDNSPMYDDIPFDAGRHQLALADVGLMGLYVADCDALAAIADLLDRPAEAAELRSRAARYRARLATLWSEERGIFLNRRLDTGAFEQRLSPTHFYPLLAGAATQAQAERMVAEHFYNPAEFWGDWILPSISRNDPAYSDQDYWRGRIWAPMNFLVYLGLCRYDLPQARRDLAAKSCELLLKEWRLHGHVHENYSGDTGDGCDKGNSDAFYHWGGLLGLIAVLEQEQR